MEFPGARTARERASYAVVGAPLDVSTSFRPGARFGPRRIREFAAPFDDYDPHTGYAFTECGVHDAGDVRAWDDAAEYLEFLEGQLTDLADEGVVPLTLGGEHTVTAAAVRACEPDVYVCLDAHLDLREQYAGNPLSHATVTRHVLPVVDRVVLLGVRAGSEAEYERADRPEVTLVPPEEVPDWEPDIEGTAYLSVDIDAADPGFAPGTGTMEPFGLTPREMRRVVRAVAPDCVGCDAVEVNDRDDGQAAALAAKLLRTFVYEHAADRD